MDGQTTVDGQSGADEDEEHRNTSADTRVENESLRKTLFSSLSMPAFTQSESKKTLRTKLKKKQKKSKYKVQEKEDEEEDDEEEEVEEMAAGNDEEEQDDEETQDYERSRTSEDEENYEDEYDGKVQFNMKIKPKRDKSHSNVKYVPIPVYL